MSAKTKAPKEGIRCREPHPDLEDRACNELLLEERDGVLGIACQRGKGKHFQPLEVLLREAEARGWNPAPQNSQKRGFDMSRLSPRQQLILCKEDTEKQNLVHRLLKRAKALYRQDPLNLRASHSDTCEFSLDGFRISVASTDSTPKNPFGLYLVALLLIPFFVAALILIPNPILGSILFGSGIITIILCTFLFLGWPSVNAYRVTVAYRKQNISVPIGLSRIESLFGFHFARSTRDMADWLFKRKPVSPKERETIQDSRRTHRSVSIMEGAATRIDA